ncbi:MAG: hypothetical protein KGJ06_00210 [Pseudomonadota bacterium]|nr:hypothetical protein [Pseudomonadota bacterium]
MNELLHEIEEDIRHERFERLWKRAGKIMLAVSVAIVLATVVGVTVKNHQRTVAMEKTDVLMRGMKKLDMKDYQGAIADFNTLAADTHSSYYGMAMLKKAQAQEALGDKSGAQATYKALSENASAFGGLARMQSGDTATLPGRNSPFYYTESEMRAWQLLQQGKKEEAAKQFAALRDDMDAPPSLRDRMAQVLQTMKTEQKDKK